MARTLFTVVALLLAASTAHAQSTPPSTWYKWCSKGTQTTSKDGKEAKKDADVCWTFQQLRNDDTGKVSFSASLAQATVEGKDSYYFGVLVRGNIDVQGGMRVTLFPEDLWEKVRKHKKIEKNDASLDTITLKLASAPCPPEGCTFQIEATPDLITTLKRSGGFVVYATSGAGVPVAWSVSLAGFAKAWAGEPYNWRELLNWRWRIPQNMPMICDQAFWPGC